MAPKINPNVQRHYLLSMICDLQGRMLVKFKWLPVGPFPQFPFSCPWKVSNFQRQVTFLHQVLPDELIHTLILPPPLPPHRKQK